MKLPKKSKHAVSVVEQRTMQDGDQHSAPEELNEYRDIPDATAPVGAKMR